MDFGAALQAAVTQGARISRAGWNGDNQWVAYEPGEEKPSPERDTDRYGPCLMIRTVDRSYVPWLPSQSDLFAEDWSVTVQVTGSFDEPEPEAQSEGVAKGWGGIRG